MIFNNIKAELQCLNINKQTRLIIKNININMTLRKQHKTF